MLFSQPQTQSQWKESEELFSYTSKETDQHGFSLSKLMRFLSAFKDIQRWSFSPTGISFTEQHPTACAVVSARLKQDTLSISCPETDEKVSVCVKSSDLAKLGRIFPPGRAAEVHLLPDKSVRFTIKAAKSGDVFAVLRQPEEETSTDDPATFLSILIERSRKFVFAMPSKLLQSIFKDLAETEGALMTIRIESGHGHDGASLTFNAENTDDGRHIAVRYNTTTSGIRMLSSDCREEEVVLQVPLWQVTKLGADFLYLGEQVQLSVGVALELKVEFDESELILAIGPDEGLEL